MIGHYNKKEEKYLTNEELLAKVQESIQREAEEIKKNFTQTPFPMMYPYMPIPTSGMQIAAVQPEKQAQEQTQISQTEEINDAALDFMDSFMGG